MDEEQVMPDNYDKYDEPEVLVYGYLPDGKGWRCKMISLGSGHMYYPMPPASEEEKSMLDQLREITGYKEDEGE